MAEQLRLGSDDLNRNLLSPLTFKFFIKKLPEFNFFVQDVSLPGLELGVYQQPTPFKEFTVYGDHVTYAPLTATFKVNEDLGNYIEINTWLRQIGFPVEFAQHKTIADKSQTSGDGIYSDASLMVLNSASNPYVEIKIKDLVPIALSGLQFSSKDTQVTYQDAEVTFAFRDYTLNPL